VAGTLYWREIKSKVHSSGNYSRVLFAYSEHPPGEFSILYIIIMSSALQGLVHCETETKLDAAKEFDEKVSDTKSNTWRLRNFFIQLIY